MDNKTTISKHRLNAIQAAADEIQQIAKRIMFNNSLRGRNISAQAQIIKDNVRLLQTINEPDKEP